MNLAFVKSVVAKSSKWYWSSSSCYTRTIETKALKFLEYSLCLKIKYQLHRHLNAHEIGRCILYRADRILYPVYIEKKARLGGRFQWNRVFQDYEYVIANSELFLEQMVITVGVVNEIPDTHIHITFIGTFPRRFCTVLWISFVFCPQKVSLDSCLWASLRRRERRQLASQRINRSLMPWKFPPRTWKIFYCNKTFEVKN